MAASAKTLNLGDKVDHSNENFGKAVTLQNQMKRDPNRKNKKLHLRVRISLKYFSMFFRF